MEDMQEDAVDRPLHLRVREARKLLKMTQREVATKAGIGLRTYQMFEKGGHTPQPANLEAIRWAVGLEEKGAAEPALTPLRVLRPPGDASEDAWPLDVRIFLDVMGAFLVTMDEPERIDFIHDATRWIVNRRR